MNELIRGTTPTVIIQFKKVQVESLDAAYLTLKVAGNTIIEKPIEEASIDTEEDNIRWKQTQEETFRLTAGQIVNVCCDWKQGNGTRGRSKIVTYKVAEPGKDVVI